MTLNISWFTRRGAEAFDRRVYNVPDYSGLGWRPYTIRITRDSLAEVAFNDLGAFRRWLDAHGLRVRLTGGTRGLRWGNLETITEGV